jgi:hypothetical protein
MLSSRVIGSSSHSGSLAEVLTLGKIGRWPSSRSSASVNTNATQDRLDLRLYRDRTCSLFDICCVVNLLLIPANYPYPGAEWFGPQNEHSALALQKLVRHLEVFTPRPYAPRLLAFNDRWGASRGSRKDKSEGVFLSIH